MNTSETVTIKVKKGINVKVQEVDRLDGDRVLVAEAPRGLKIAIQQVEAANAPLSASKITMCG